MTNVRWANDDSRLVSVGGADTSVMVWKHVRADERRYAAGDSDDSDTDSEEEGGYDSDVEREKNLNYSDKIYANPIRTTKGVKPHLRQSQEQEARCSDVRTVLARSFLYFSGVWRSYKQIIETYLLGYKSMKDEVVLTQRSFKIFSIVCWSFSFSPPRACSIRLTF